MKVAIVVLAALLALCNAAPSPAPAPKADPSLVYTAPAIVAAPPAVSYSHYYRSPLYATYNPYVYNYGYASSYGYGAYPYYVL